ncbi:MAG: hypothetical protein RSA86_03020 [Christensenellaceae bacterium]
MRKKKYARYMNRGRINVMRFMRKHKKMLLIALAAIIAVCVVLFLVVPNVTKNQNVQSNEPTQEELTANEQIDDETLAGLTGEDDSLFSQNGDFVQEGLKIGVTMLELNSDDTVMVSGMEKAAAQDIKEKTLGDFIVYDAQGDQNQQIQDVYSMINKGVKVIVVTATDTYNFTKIADIAKSNQVAVVAYNSQATTGFAANIKKPATAATDFAEFIKKSGQTSTQVLNAAPKQAEQVAQVLPVDAQYTDLWEAISAVDTSITDAAPKQSMIVFDENAYKMLRAWFAKSTYPSAYAGVATVDYIKAWYSLLNGGFTYLPPAQEGEPQTEEPILVNASAAQFHGLAITTVQNTGDIVYEFAFQLANGKKLAQSDFVYEMSGAEQITNENLAQYYEKCKDSPEGLVYTTVDTADLAGLFS